MLALGVSVKGQQTIFLILIFLLAGRALEVFAQQEDLVFKHLSIEQGLSQSIVGATTQDRRGFMWFVTEDGLNRFDGYGFEVFKHDAKDPASLNHNEIKCIAEDRNGLLWVGTFYRGLEHFDPSTRRFTHYQHDPQNPNGLANDIVWALLVDRDGRLWVGTGEGGLDLFDEASGTFKHFRNDPKDASSLSNNDVRVLSEDKSGAIWVGTAGGGLNRLDPATGKFTRWNHDPANLNSLSSNDVRSLVQDADRALWVGTFGGGLNRLDPKTGAFTRFRNDPGNPKSLANDNVLALLIDGKQNLWVGTDGGGLNRLVRTNGTFLQYIHSPNRPTSLAGDRIFSLYRDRSDILWVGTYGNGVSRCDLGKKQFIHYRNDPNDPNSISNDIVWSFWEWPAGTLWVGTNDGGLNRLDRASGRITRYLHDPGNPGSLSHNSVRMVIADRMGMIWLVTNGGGLDRLDPRTGIFKHYRHDDRDPGSLSHDELRMVIEDSRGTLWVGAYGGGLDRFVPATDRFVHYRHDPDDPKSISGNYVRTAVEDKAGMLWFGTHGSGLNKYDRALGTFTRYRNDPKDPSTISNDFIFCIHEDREGGLWVATYGGGLNLLDRKTGTFTAFRKSDGLPDDAVYGILEDPSGNLWLSTNSGIAKFDPKTRKVRNYTMADGLQSNEFNGGAFYQNQSGEMFFGGINGFNVFDPARIRDDDYKAPLVFTDFQLFSHTVPVGPMPDGRTLLTRTIYNTSRIDLTYWDRVASFEFASLDYASPEKNRYAYKLDGLDQVWTELGSRRTLMFTTLPPGHYTLRVKGTNGDGIWNEEGAALRLIVNPPWWRTLWAYVLYGFMLTGVVYLIVLFERRREREKGELVEAELRTKAAELQSRTVEAEARVLKLENDRKAHELEEARKLQLSMLPTRLPVYPHYTIAARMQTATEVGGDYYDFIHSEDGSLTIAMGDATGHGTRAGIMVAIMKTLFVGTPLADDLQELFRGFNRTLHGIGMDQIYMALGILRLRGPHVHAISAAVPPLFIWRSLRQEMEIITLRGMFLGTKFEISYEEAHLTLESGDKILLLSDGFLEQPGELGDRMDEQRAAAHFREVASAPPVEIIDHLLRTLGTWRGSLPQDDDVTIVVLEYCGT